MNLWLHRATTANFHFAPSYFSALIFLIFPFLGTCTHNTVDFEFFHPFSLRMSSPYREKFPQVSSCIDPSGFAFHMVNEFITRYTHTVCLTVFFLCFTQQAVRVVKGFCVVSRRFTFRHSLLSLWLITILVCLFIFGRVFDHLILQKC